MPPDRPAPTATEPGPAPGAEPPRRLREIDRRTLWRTLKRTVSEFREDDLTDWAAALTYYGILALFPALLLLVSLLGLFGDPERTTEVVTEIVGELGPQSAVDAFTGPIESITANRGAAGVLFFVGLAGALLSASGYVGAFMRASNAIYEIEEGRPFWKLRPLQIAVTIVMVLLLAAVAIALVLTGPLAEAVGGVIGLGDTALTVWSIAKWPVLLVIVMAMFAALYYIAPNVRQPGFRWVSPGGVVAVLAWIAASAGFALYVANFGSYQKTYGTLAGVMIFLVWLWISNLALLFGAELDAEVERGRELEAGLPAEEEIQLPPRESPAKT